MKLNRIFLFFIAIFLTIIADSCYKHEEGCQDINAINYDVEADKNCEDNCCKYPKVNLQFKMLYDTVEIDTNNYFTNFAGDSLRIRMLRMYLSNFVITENTGKVHNLHNEITLGYGDDSIPEFKKTNYTSIKINEKGGVFQIGSLDKLALYNQINFVFGIDSVINHASIDKITTSSYLHQFSDSMHINRKEGYIFLNLLVNIRDKKEKNIIIYGDENLRRLSLGGLIDFRERENHLFAVDLDLNKWLYNIDFINSPDSEIKQLLLQKLNPALTLH